MQTPALRTVGNICAQEAEQTQAVLDCGALPRLGALLHSPKKEMRKEACWAVSNITAGPTAQVEAACAAGLVPRLVELASEEEYEEEGGGVRAVQLRGRAERGALRRLVDLGVLPPLLTSSPARRPPPPHLLDAIEAMLRAGVAAAGADVPPAANSIAALVREADGVDYIEALQEHENGEVYQLRWRSSTPSSAATSPRTRSSRPPRRRRLGFAFCAVADGDAAPFCRMCLLDHIPPRCSLTYEVHQQPLAALEITCLADTRGLRFVSGSADNTARIAYHGLAVAP